MSNVVAIIVVVGSYVTYALIVAGATRAQVTREKVSIPTAIARQKDAK